MQVCIFEDQYCANFYPLVYFRPVFDLRCGVFTLREKLEHLFPRVNVTLIVRRELAALVREENPRNPVNTSPGENCWIINGRLLADRRLAALVKQNFRESRAFYRGDELVAARITGKDLPPLGEAIGGGLLSASALGGIPSEQCDFTLITYPWELLQHTANELEHDFTTSGTAVRRAKAERTRSPDARLVSRRNILLGGNCRLGPGAVLDASTGPIVLGNSVTVMANAVIEGPACIGEHATVKAGTRIHGGCSVGRWCKVGGELDASVLQEFSNKQHDGFLGHSYLGSWVNIGAGTNTSDLKNTYGTVKVDLRGARIDTRSQFLGTIMGDHSKAGIGTMFNSGTVVGLSCNVFGAGFQPVSLPSFTWTGTGGLEEYELEKSLATARAMMLRRHVGMTAAYEQRFRDIFTLTADERHRAGIRPRV